MAPFLIKGFRIRLLEGWWALKVPPNLFSSQFGNWVKKGTGFTGNSGNPLFRGKPPVHFWRPSKIRPLMGLKLRLLLKPPPLEDLFLEHAFGGWLTTCALRILEGRGHSPFWVVPPSRVFKAGRQKFPPVSPIFWVFGGATPFRRLRAS